MTPRQESSWLSRLRERGVVRVAASYAVIAWLLLQIADVVLEPLGAPPWAMTALVIAAAAGFPLALALAWFLEIGNHGVQIDTAAEGTPRPVARGLRHYADAIVIGILLITVAVLLVRQSDFARPAPPENPAIAVLPFENLSGDPEQEYFSDGLAEEVLDRLGRVPGLRVIARSSSFGFKGRKVDVRTIAEKLDVTTLLEGSVRRDGRRLKLTARLVDGTTGQQVWSGSFDRELVDVFAVQAELAGAIVDAIIPAARGNVAEDPTAPTTDLNAYDLYLSARAQLLLRTDSSVRKAVELSEQAVRLDPDFARGQAQLAKSLLFEAMFLGESEPGRADALRRRAETAVHRALSLDPDLSEAHGAYANLLRDTGRPGAIERYQRALELNPNNAVAWHDYSVYLSNVEGRHEEANEATARALALDPRQPVSWANHLKNLVANDPQRFRKEFQQALRTIDDMPFAIDRISMPELAVAGYPVEVLQAGLAKDSSQADNIPSWVNRFRAWTAVDLGRAEQVLAGPDVPGTEAPPALLAQAFFAVEVNGRQGDWAGLERALAELRARVGEADPRVHSVTAFWLTVQGRHEEAARALARAEPLPLKAFPGVLGVDSLYGLMETAQVRIYRATGRKDEAERLANEHLEALRALQRATGKSCLMSMYFNDQGTWLQHASLAAEQGLRDEAVEALRGALRCGDLPGAFEPSLPWFRSLEGHAPYDALLRERQQRVQRIRGTLERLEADLLDGTSPPR